MASATIQEASDEQFLIGIDNGTQSKARVVDARPDKISDAVSQVSHRGYSREHIPSESV